MSPHTKFHPNRLKNTEVENFHFWSILVGQGGRPKNSRRHFKLNLCCFCPIISSHTKFHPNWTKTIEVRNFQCWSVQVGWAGRMKNGHRHFKRILSCCCSIFSPPYQISSESDKKHRSQKFSLLLNLGWQVAKWTQVGISNSFYVVFAPFGLISKLAKGAKK